MNPNDPFERHPEHPKAAPPAPPRAPSPLALHGDPSQAQRDDESMRSAAPRRPGVEFVRLSDLPGRAQNVVMRRGVDLFAELVRRGRRAPVTIPAAGVRKAASAVAVHRAARRAAQTGPTREGLGS